MSRRPRGETRREILNSAQRLMQRYGFHGFSYHHIAAELSLRTAAIHYHFPAKADLGVAVLGRFREDFRWWWREQRRRNVAAADRLEAFFDIDVHYVTEARVCPLGVMGVEYAGLSGAMCREADALLADVLAFLTETLDAGRADGSVVFTGDAADGARHALAATQGGLQIARVQADPEAFQAVLRGVRHALGLGGSGSGARLVG